MLEEENLKSKMDFWSWLDKTIRPSENIDLKT